MGFRYDDEIRGSMRDSRRGPLPGVCVSDDKGRAAPGGWLAFASVVASDWESIEMSISERWLGRGSMIGVIWTAAGVLGLVLVLAIGRPNRLRAGIFTMALES